MGKRRPRVFRNEVISSYWVTECYVSRIIVNKDCNAWEHRVGQR